MEVFTQACPPGADIQSLTYRAMMLQVFVSHAQNQVAPWTKDGHLTEGVFREVAQVSMEWMGVGVERKGLPFDADELLRRITGQAPGKCGPVDVY